MNINEIRKLINEVYVETCYELAERKCSSDTEISYAIDKEKEYYAKYLEQYFEGDNNFYYVLEHNDKWISAARVSKTKDYYYLEALETNPDCRRKGYGIYLLQEIIKNLEKNEEIILKCNVGKYNRASIELHKKCGYIIDKENGFDFTTNEERTDVYAMCYKTRLKENKEERY